MESLSSATFCEPSSGCLRIADFFAGIGGIRLGVEHAFGPGAKTVFANDISEAACRVYEANFVPQGILVRGDIAGLDSSRIPAFDMLLAGFPCQAFSSAGKKQGFEDEKGRGVLFFYLAAIIKKHRPAVLLLENVPNLLYHARGRTAQEIFGVLEKTLGYTITFKIINAADFGLAQHRPRLYIVGFREPEFCKRFSWPSPIGPPPALKSVLEDAAPPEMFLSARYLSSLIAHRDRHARLGHGFGFRILDPAGVANTLVAGGMGIERNLIEDPIRARELRKAGHYPPAANPDAIRKMTPREWARLQGFPDSFRFPVSRTVAYGLIANSVPVAVVRAIASEIRAAAFA